MEKPFGTDLRSARSGSTTRCTRPSTSSRSSGSTTSSARRRRRTSSLSASPTVCSSRSGTATSSTTSRSTSPRQLGLDRRAGFYEATGAYKDMVVTHLFQVLAFVAMEPPTALEPRAISEEKNKVFRSMLPIDPRNVVRGQYMGYRGGGGGGAATPTPRRSSRCRRASTTGAGPGCRSTCAPASGWPRGSGSSRSPSRRRRRACSPPAPGSVAGARPPDLRPGRRVQGVAVVLRQAARTGDEAGQALHAVLHPGDRPAPPTCWRRTSG